MAELRPKKAEIVYNNSSNEETPAPAPAPQPVIPAPNPAPAKPKTVPPLKKVEIVYNDSDDETAPAPAPAPTTTTKTTQPKSKKKPKITSYEIVFNEETGAMERVPVYEKPEAILKPEVEKKRKKRKYKKDEILILSHPEHEEGQPDVYVVYDKKIGETIHILKEDLPEEIQKEIDEGKVELPVISDIEKMRLFYLRRGKDPLHFTYTAEGNLEIKDIQGVPNEVIPLRKFTDLTMEEIDQLETQRKTELAENEENYEDKMMMLREAYTEYLRNGRRNPEKVFRLNEELREASLVRNQKAFPLRWNKVLENPSTNEILYSQPYEVRKLGYEVYLFKRFPFDKEDSLGHYRDRTTETEGQTGGSMEMVFITDEESPFHPARETTFVFDETKFSSPYQAYLYQRFKEVGDKDLMSKLLGTKSALTMTNLVADRKESPSSPQTLWLDILKELYSQNKDMAKRLDESGHTSPFYLQDTKKFKDTFDPKMYADALQKVRTMLREQEDDGVNPRSYSNKSITDEEQKKARTGAIVNMYRNRKF